MGVFSEMVSAHRAAVRQSEQGTCVERQRARQKLGLLQDQMLDAFASQNKWDDDDKVAYRWIVSKQ